MILDATRCLGKRQGRGADVRGEEACEGQSDSLLLQGKGAAAHEGSGSLGHTALTCAQEGPFDLPRAGITLEAAPPSGGGTRGNGLEKFLKLAAEEPQDPSLDNIQPSCARAGLFWTR